MAKFNSTNRIIYFVVVVIILSRFLCLHFQFNEQKYIRKEDLVYMIYDCIILHASCLCERVLLCDAASRLCKSGRSRWKKVDSYIEGATNKIKKNKKLAATIIQL